MITGKTDAGDIRASDRIEVIVTEKESLVIGGWSAGDTGRSAVRALSAVGAVLAQAAIWIGIFSPVWIAVLVVGFFVRRRMRRITAVTTNIVTVAEQVNRGDDLPPRLVPPIMLVRRALVLPPSFVDGQHKRPSLTGQQKCHIMEPM